MTEEALVRRDACLGAINLSLARLAAELPSEFANLCDGLSRNRFAEAAEAPGRLHRAPAVAPEHPRRAGAVAPGRL